MGANPELPATPRFDREVRLGVVLYGGVSLAVYIGGVVRELFDAVHGRGVYGLLRELIGSDVKVDIISGTSAGGINGVLLAFALANNLELDELATLWREQGDLAKLMRGVGEPAPPSLLDGAGYFQQKLDAALQSMLDRPNKQAKEPPVDAIDLFVTATDFRGQLGFVLDDLSDVIAIKDHRRVFQLKFRKGRNINDLTPAANGKHVPEWRRALATVCRATATFPGAFEPVEVPADEREGSERALWHHWLHDWSASKSPHDFVLVDGGVIDNKPFTHTLKAIYARTTEREVDRKLVFCEPDPENFDPPTSEIPDFGEVVVAAVSTLPGYETIADDLQNLADHNARVASYQELVRNLSKLELPKQTPEFRRDFYVRARIIGYSENLLSEVIAARQTDARARRDAGGKALDDERNMLRALAQRVRKTATKKMTEQLLRDVDVTFRQRRLFHVVYELYDELYQPIEPPEELELAEREAWLAKKLGERRAREPAIRALLPKLNAQLHLLKIVGWIDSEWREEFGKRFLGKPDDGLWERYYERLAYLLSAVPNVKLLEEPSALHKELMNRLAAITNEGWTSRGERPGLLDQIEARVSCGEESYKKFEVLDELTYPIETLAHLEQKDPIDTLRISPRDAQLGFCKREAYDKVTGEALGHFGAFLKRSWRSNDIMWGRMDSVTLLIQELLSARAVANARTNPKELQRVFEEMFGRSELKNEVQVMRDWLALLDQSRDAASRALEDKKSKVHEALATLAQAQRIEQELGNVLYDSVMQGKEWGAVDARSDGLDAHVATWSATQIKALSDAFQKKPPEQPPVAPVPIAFKNYKVGEETLTRDVPPMVLLRMVMHTALVMQRVLAPVFQRAMPLGSAKLLVPAFTVVRWVTLFIYGFALTGRTKPVVTGLTLTSIAMLGLSIPLQQQIWPSHGGVDWYWATGLLLVPAGYLALFLLFVQRSWVSAVSAAMVTGGIGMAAGLASNAHYTWLTEAVSRVVEGATLMQVSIGLVPVLLVSVGLAVLSEPWRRKRRGQRQKP